MGLVRPPRISRVISFLLIIGALCPCVIAKVIYVDDDATGANDGTSWADAYLYLQDALADANESPKPVEIHVAQGMYKPDRGADQTLGDREATFRLINGVSLIGGFAGSSVSDPNARDVEVHVAILSGDLDADESEGSYPAGANSYHVLTGSWTNETAVLDGFVITGGMACGPSLGEQDPDQFRLQWGGGMYNFEGSPTLVNCTFIRNGALSSGGIANRTNSSPTLTNCAFIGNRGDIGWLSDWGYGGGMANRQNSNPTLTNCNFSGNNWAMNGGCMYNSHSNPILTNCTFSGNEGSIDGGGIYNNHSSPTLIECTFSNCRVSHGGGGIYNRDNSNPTLTSCVFTGCSARDGGGIYNREDSYSTLTNCTFAQNSAENGSALVFWCSEEMSPRNLELTNCILWDDGNEIWSNANSTIIISYSDIQGGFPGEGNIDADPLFADLGFLHDNGTPDDASDDSWVDRDYHLKSEAGRWDPNSASWVFDDVTSPCIDAGDPNSDWRGETWPHGQRINMGAYGGTRQASMSLRIEEMSLPRVAYIFSHKSEVAETFQSLLESYGCPTTLIKRADVAATPLDTYDLVIVANDTRYETTWSDPNTVAAIEDSGKPVIGLGDGGYDFYGLLGLSIGSPNGGHGNKNSIDAINPDSALFRTPYHIEIPQDRVLQLYTETKHVGLYFWPTIPDTVTVLGREVNDAGFFPLAMEHGRYLLWGFAESPEKMTEVGKELFLNIVIRTANRNWRN